MNNMDGMGRPPAQLIVQGHTGNAPPISGWDQAPMPLYTGGNALGSHFRTQSSEKINEKITSFNNPKDIIDLVRNNINSLDHFNIMTAVYRIAKMKLDFLINTPKPVRISFFKLVNGWFKEYTFAESSPRELATTAWAYATLGVHDQPLISALTKELCRRNLDHFLPHHLASISWAFAKLNVCDKAVMGVIADEVRRRNIESFSLKHLTNIVWAYATMGICDQSLMGVIANEVKRRNFSEFKPQDLANISWAYAVFNLCDHSLLSSIANEIKRRDLKEFVAQSLATIAWTFASFGIKDQHLMASIAHEVSRRFLLGFDPQSLANIVWAYGKLEICDQPLTNAILKEVSKRNLCGFTSQQLSNISWGFAKLGVCNQTLMCAIANESRRRNLTGFKPQEIARIAWAYAILGIYDQPLMDLISKEVERRRIINFSPKHLAIIAWAYAVFDNLELIDLERFIDSFKNQLKFPREQLRQLAQVMREPSAACLTWPRWLLASIERYQKGLENSPPRESNLGREVRKVLRQMQPAFQERVFLGNLYWVGFFHPETKAVLDLDGANNEGRIGAIRLKERYLTALGYRVVRLNKDAWNAAEDKQGLLKRLLPAETFLEWSGKMYAVNPVVPNDPSISFNHEMNKDGRSHREVIADTEFPDEQGGILKEKVSKSKRRRMNRKAKLLAEMRDVKPAVANAVVDVALDSFPGIMLSRVSNGNDVLNEKEITVNASDKKGGAASLKVALTLFAALVSVGGAFYAIQNKD